MSNIRPNTKKFLDLKPTLLCTIRGYKLYEDPIYGDEGMLVAITPRGRVRRTCFHEIPDTFEFEYQIEEWSKKVVVYHTDNIREGELSSAKIVNSLTGELITECESSLVYDYLLENGLTSMITRRVNHETYESHTK